MEERNVDVLIIGGGVAGLTAGIYSARSGLKTLIIEKNAMCGGQASLTSEIENYPGYKKTDGFTLTENIRTQAEDLGAEFIYGAILDLKLTDDEKIIKMESVTINAKSVILCMGAEPRKLESAISFEGRGVSYCATCDGAFFRNKTAVVLGGGDTAVADALYLARFLKKVYLVHRRNEFRAAKILVERAKALPNVEIILNAEFISVNGWNVVENVALKVNGINRELETNALFVAIGRVPETAMLKGKINLDNHGYIIAGEDMKTNVKGVFTAGDIRTKSLRQIITACSDGAISAEEASIFISQM